MSPAINVRPIPARDGWFVLTPVTARNTRDACAAVGAPELADGIGFVTLNRPAARNALTFAMYEGLAEICGRVGKTATKVEEA